MNGRRQLSMVIAMIASLVYLTYRAAFTLNFDGPFATATSLSLFLAECYGCFLMFLYFFQIWVIKNPEPVPPLEERTVDVFIPTYNEDPDLLRGTISAALKIDYPHNTYLLDDGKRPEVKALCEELGCAYLTRGSNIHAKAGNLNHALDQTDGEFLIIFDADHVAERHFIDRLIGYFEDEKLGFIQTPHSFYNFDAYQGLLNYESGSYWEEGMLFYNVTQPGKNHWDGVSFCGSAAMFRRSALADVGLVAVESITEDMHTGIRMHSKGWHSLFVNERLITAQAAPDITSFNTQRLRWGEGNLGVMGFDNPITVRGLTLAQRLCYLGSMLSWTTGVQKLVIYLAPIIMLFSNVPPVVNLSWTLAAITFAYLVAVWTGVKVSSNGYGNLLGIELTQMACFWTQAKATWRAVFNRKTANFVVTSKRGRQSNSVLKEVRPQIAYIIASGAAIAWAATRYGMGVTTDAPGLSIGIGLLLFHSLLAWVVIRRAMRPDCQRYSWRHPASLHAEIGIVTDDNEAFVYQGVTKDINERGVGFVTFDELPEVERASIRLSAGDRSVSCEGDIRWRKTLVNYRSRRDGLTKAYAYGMEFIGLTTAQLSELWWFGAQYAVARQYEKFKGGSFGIDPGSIERVAKRKIEQQFDLPVTVVPWGEEPLRCVTESLCAESFVVLLPKKYDSDHAFEMRIDMPFGPVHAWGTAGETATRVIAGEQFIETRINIVKFDDEGRGRLKSLEGHGQTADLLPTVRLKPSAMTLPTFRPTALATSAATLAASVTVAVALYLEKDEAIIANVNRGSIPGDSDVVRLHKMVDRIQTSEKVDEDQVLRLRAAMKRLDEDEEVMVLDEVLAKHSTLSDEGQILKAISLHNLGRYDEAERIFIPLVARIDDPELQLAAARNAIRLGNLHVAYNRFENLRSLGLATAEERIEYAGVAARVGKIDVAISLLDANQATIDERLLLASLYSAEKRFVDAITVYEGLLADAPESVKFRRLIADNHLWNNDGRSALPHYRAVIESDNNDRQLLVNYAQALLSAGEYRDGADAFRRLLLRPSADIQIDSEDGREQLTSTRIGSRPAEVDSQRPVRLRRGHESAPSAVVEPDERVLKLGFLDCAANATDLTGESDRYLRQLLSQQRGYADDIEFASRLLHAASRLGESESVIPILQELVIANPQSQQLRLRLADSLHEMRRYRDADFHYSILVSQTAMIAEEPAKSVQPSTQVSQTPSQTSSK